MKSVLYRAKVALMLILFLFFSLTFTGCGVSEPFDTVERYVDACNNMDMEAMLDCYDPRMMDTFYEGLGLFSGALDIPNMSGLLSGSSLSYISDLLGDYAASYVEEQHFFSVEEISTTYKDDNHAVVVALFTIEVDGEVYDSTETFNLIYIDGDWYITMTLSDWQKMGW